MMEIRRRLVDGENNDTIQQALGLNRRTYFRLAKRVFQDDIKVLAQANEKQIMRQLVIHLERTNNIYQHLQSIATDTSINAEYRIEACRDMFKVSSVLVESYGLAPAVAMNQRRKLAAMAGGILPESMSGNNPTGGRYLPPAMFHKNNKNSSNQRSRSRDFI